MSNTEYSRPLLLRMRELDRKDLRYAVMLTITVVSRDVDRSREQTHLLRRLRALLDRLEDVGG